MVVDRGEDSDTPALYEPAGAGMPARRRWRGALNERSLSRRRRITACGAAVLFGLIEVTDRAQSATPSSLAGSWGGAHIRLIASESGARVEYDCATGTIDEPLRPDGEGRFDARGSYAQEHGGPVLPGEPPSKPRQARYRGWTDGTDMRLTVTVLDTGADIGTFSLRRDRPALLEKCL